MSEEAITKRHNRAVERAVNILNCPQGRYKIIRLNDPNCPFHIECIRLKEVMKIRIALDFISDEDVKLCESWRLNELFTKEIWCTIPGSHKFQCMEI